MKNLFPKIKVKRKTATECKYCEEKIEIGTDYVSVMYSDGFTVKPFGAYHLDCWIKYESQNNIV